MYHINIQHAADKSSAPASSLLRLWAECGLKMKIDFAEITIRIVNLEEMTQLNETYRHKKGPTNVLSFPFMLPKDIPVEIPYLGDIVICSDVVNRESIEQNKSPNAHWAHMIVHGVFHLLGYDHETDKEAEEMEALEIKAMQELGFPNPYNGENI